jgi:hypothetical protein
LRFLASFFCFLRRRNRCTNCMHIPNNFRSLSKACAGEGSRVCVMVCSVTTTDTISLTNASTVPRQPRLLHPLPQRHPSPLCFGNRHPSPPRRGGILPPVGVHSARPVNQLPCEELLPLRPPVPNASNRVVEFAFATTRPTLYLTTSATTSTALAATGPAVEP